VVIESDSILPLWADSSITYTKVVKILRVVQQCRLLFLFLVFFVYALINTTCYWSSCMHVWESKGEMWPIWYRLTSVYAHAMAQAVNCWPVTVEARVCAWVSPCGICGGQKGTGTGFSLSYLVFPCQCIISPLLHTHVSSPHELCVSPDQAEHYHTIDLKLRSSCLNRHLAGTEERNIIIYLYANLVLRALFQARLVAHISELLCKKESV
jgi:hypothetical protein